jgi:hypothetical protein
VNDRHGQFDVAHALATYFFLRHLDTAAVAHDTFVADTLVFAAVALVVLGRTEYTLAKQTFHLRLVRTVVDRFRFLDLP